MTSPERKPRCQRFVTDKRGRNPCANEELGDTELCLRHLREAADHWKAVVEHALEQFPGLGGALGEETSE